MTNRRQLQFQTGEHVLASGYQIPLCVTHELMPESEFSIPSITTVYGLALCRSCMLAAVDVIGPDAYTVQEFLQDAKNNEEGIFRASNNLSADQNRKGDIRRGIRLPNENLMTARNRLVDEVLAGKWGDGAVRRERLGHMYPSVQREVNYRLGLTNSSERDKKGT